MCARNLQNKCKKCARYVQVMRTKTKQETSKVLHGKCNKLQGMCKKLQGKCKKFAGNAQRLSRFGHEVCSSYKQGICKECEEKEVKAAF